MEIYTFFLFCGMISSLVAQSYDIVCKSRVPKCVETGGLCLNGGPTVYEKDGTYHNCHCYCPVGTEYVKNTGCKVSVDLCKLWAPKCLETGGSCKKDGTYAYLQCFCPDGTEYVQDKGCKDKCLSIKCHNDGKCGIRNGRAVCFCNERFTGDSCNIDKCSLIKCPDGGKCGIKNGNAFCFCDERYEDDFCSLDKCSLISCQRGGTCKIQDGKATCSCIEDYWGDFCEKKCNCKNGTCKEISGMVECICNPEYGKYTEAACKACECGKGANCTFLKGDEASSEGMKNKTCLCPNGFIEENGVCIDKCSQITCENEGRCEIRNGKALCVCKDKYTGNFCETDKCTLIRCLNGGKCEVRNSKTSCICNDDFTGEFCGKSRT